MHRFSSGHSTREWFSKYPAKYSSDTVSWRVTKAEANTPDIRMETARRIAVTWVTRTKSSGRTLSTLIVRINGKLRAISRNHNTLADSIKTTTTRRSSIWRSSADWPNLRRKKLLLRRTLRHPAELVASIAAETTHPRQTHGKSVPNDRRWIRCAAGWDYVFENVFVNVWLLY